MDVKHIYRNKWVQIGAVSAVLIGGGVGTAIYIYRRKKQQKPTPKPESNQLNFFDHVVTSNDAVVIEINPSPKFEDLPEDAIIIEMPSVMDYNKISTDDSEETEDQNDEPPTPYNIFGNGSQKIWNHDEEVASRSTEEPYVLHEDEFIENESGYNQTTVTYYAGDDIMADQEDTPIYNYSGLMGELKFGHGTTDVNVVYIRNDMHKKEWEVLLHPGKFAIEVLGHQYDDEEVSLQHSVHKFREE